MGGKRRAMAIIAVGLMAFGLNPGVSAAEDIPPSGLLLEYGFDGENTQVAEDSSGNGNGGEIRGAAELKKGSLELTGGYVKMPDGLLADKSAATIQIETAPAASSLNGAQHLWTIGGTANHKNGTGQMFIQPAKNKFTITKTNWSAESHAISKKKIEENVWQSITVTIEKNASDGTSTMVFYIDGIEVARNAASNTGLADLKVHNKNLLGASAYDTNKRYTGEINTFRIYDRALSRDEVADIAEADAKKSAQIALDQVDLGDTSALTKNLKLPVARGLEWSTDNEKVIDANGTIHPGPKRNAATLSATYTVRGKSVSKKFPVTVAGALSTTSKISADLAAIIVPNANDIRSSINLPSVGSKWGSEITWTASPKGIISTEKDGEKAAGILTRPKTDTAVTLTATATLKAKQATKTIEVQVKAATEIPKMEGYLFSYFTGAEETPTDEQIYFSTSTNGVQWRDMTDSSFPILESNIGEKGVRDPYLIRSPEGDKFYLLATDLSIHNRSKGGGVNTGSPNIIIWESNNLVDWSEPRLANVASKIKEAGIAKAPEAYWIEDTCEYMLFWTSASKPENEIGDKTNVYYATTRDFVNFSDPVKWIDRAHPVTDTTMLRANDGWYYRVSTDEQLTIEKTLNPYATTTAATASEQTNSGKNEWAYVGRLAEILNNDNYTGAQLEGPELFRFNDSDIKRANGDAMPYALMVDQHPAGRGYLSLRSADLSSAVAANWMPAIDTNLGTLTKRHGTILPITAKEMENVIAKYSDQAKIVPPDPNGSAPIASYTFNDEKARGADNSGNDNTMSFEGTTTFVEVPELGGATALQLSGDGGHGIFPQGLFDGRNEITIEFSAKSNLPSGNFSTFALGKSDNRYLYARLRGSVASAAITGSGYQNENGITASVSTSTWHDYAVTLTPERLAFYVDGKLASENSNVRMSVAEMGTKLEAFLGKSFFQTDLFFIGAYANVNVFNYAKTADEIAGTEPPVIEVAATTHCVDEEVVVAAKVKNIGEQPEDVLVQSPYGSKFITINGGKTVSVSLPTRLPAVPDGKIRASSESRDNHEAEVVADFSATTCQ